MPTTVDIIIKGVAICYEKTKNDKKKWKVLFPYNECHSVKFSYRKNDEKLTKVGHLAMANRKIEINVSSDAQLAESQSECFKKYALDLTNQDSEKPKTHTEIRLKEKLKDDWNKKAVLLTIQKAKMCVLDYIQDYTDEDIFLRSGETDQPVDNAIAHWLKATINLDQEGEMLTVTSNGSTLIGTQIAAADNASYTLIFDNDCVDVEDGQNDMNMFYQLIEDKGNPERRFRLTGRHQGDGADRVIPPNVRGDKPCMFVYISKPDDTNGPLPE